MKKKKTTKELLQAICCVLNVAHTNDEVVDLIDLLEIHGGSMMPKWRQYIENRNKSTYLVAMKDVEKLLKLL